MGLFSGYVIRAIKRDGVIVRDLEHHRELYQKYRDEFFLKTYGMTFEQFQENSEKKLVELVKKKEPRNMQEKPNAEQTWEQLDAEVRRWQVLVGHAYVYVMRWSYKDDEGVQRTDARYHVLNPYQVVEEQDKETGKTTYYLLQTGGRERRKMPEGSVQRITP